MGRKRQSEDYAHAHARSTCSMLAPRNWLKKTADECSELLNTTLSDSFRPPRALSFSRGSSFNTFNTAVANATTCTVSRTPRKTLHRNLFEDRGKRRPEERKRRAPCMHGLLGLTRSTTPPCPRSECEGRAGVCTPRRMHAWPLGKSLGAQPSSWLSIHSLILVSCS